MPVKGPQPPVAFHVILSTVESFRCSTFAVKETILKSRHIVCRRVEVGDGVTVGVGVGWQNQKKGALASVDAF